MSRLGQYLFQRKLITREQLEEALNHQAVYGARLGTNLVELGMLTIEQLAEALSDFHRVPLPPRRWLERPRRSALQRVTRPLVERLRFIPMRVDGNVLRAAVLDPTDPSTLDDLRFATGCRIDPYVLPEIWMHDWLLALFKIPRGIRHIDLSGGDDDGYAEPGGGDRDDEEPVPAVVPAVPASPPAASQAVSQPAAVPPPVPAAAIASAAGPPPPMRLPPLPGHLAAGAGGHSAPAAASPAEAAEPAAFTPPRNQAPDGNSVRPPPFTVRSLADLAQGGAAAPTQAGMRANRDTIDSVASSFWEQSPDTAEMLLPDANGALAPPAATQGALVAAAPEPKLSASELGHLESALFGAGDRERLLELSLSIGACLATRVALFIVQQGMVQGLRLVEHGAPRAIEGLLVPLESVSLLTEVAAAGEPMRGDPRARAIDQRLLGLLGDEGATEVALFPVSIKQRVVNVLYASNGAEPLGWVAYGGLRALAEQMGAAYERLILSRKAAGA